MPIPPAAIVPAPKRRTLPTLSDPPATTPTPVVALEPKVSGSANVTVPPASTFNVPVPPSEKVPVILPPEPKVEANAAPIIVSTTLPPAKTLSVPLPVRPA